MLFIRKIINIYLKISKNKYHSFSVNTFIIIPLRPLSLFTSWCKNCIKTNIQDQFIVSEDLFLEENKMKMLTPELLC